MMKTDFEILSLENNWQNSSAALFIVSKGPGRFSPYQSPTQDLLHLGSIFLSRDYKYWLSTIPITKT